eukprot:365825-Chlamydomonas_euryale.AAC.11
MPTLLPRRRPTPARPGRDNHAHCAPPATGACAHPTPLPRRRPTPAQPGRDNHAHCAPPTTRACAHAHTFAPQATHTSSARSSRAPLRGLLDLQRQCSRRSCGRQRPRQRLGAAVPTAARRTWWRCGATIGEPMRELAPSLPRPC